MLHPWGKNHLFISIPIISDHAFDICVTEWSSAAQLEIPPQYYEYFCM